MNIGLFLFKYIRTTIVLLKKNILEKRQTKKYKQSKLMKTLWSRTNIKNRINNKIPFFNVQKTSMNIC